MLRSTLLVSVVLAGLLIAAPGFTGTEALPPSDATPATPAQVAPPTQCLLERNLGACVNCCKAATNVPTHFCARFCKAEIPPLPGEPQP
jgi:hypothetical protein